jgi:hypothetical protein
MPEATELAGFIGAGLAGAAYVPQIWHLIRAHCSAGLSRLAFGTWFAASLLITIHAVASGAVVFVVLGAIQLVATTLVLVYSTKYQHSYCWSHSPGGVEPPPGSAHTHSLPVADRVRSQHRSHGATQPLSPTPTATSGP